jgi:predicted ABC-type ATPase
MTSLRRLWLLAGGNGVGKSTFYRLFLQPRGVKFVNADMIASTIHPESPESASYEAAGLAQAVLDQLLHEGACFCFETVFSHPSKIDFVARAKSLGYETILVYIQLSSPCLNEARVKQRVSEGGHDVPGEKIRKRIPRLMKNISHALPLFDESRFLDNSSREDPFVQVAILKKGMCTWRLEPLPEWAFEILSNIPGQS